MTLSKSLYTRAIQCPKSLWLKKYKPEVLTLPDTSAKAVFETGNAVGELACQLFPHGKEVTFACSTAPALKPLSEYKQQNQTYSIKNTIVKVILLQKRSV